MPERFGPWQTVWKRHARFCRDGTWDKVLAAVIASVERIVVEASFALLAQWRGLATRYDTHALIYRGAVALDWTRT